MPRKSTAQERLRLQLEAGTRAQKARDRLLQLDYSLRGTLDDPATGCECEVWQKRDGTVRLILMHAGGWDVYKPVHDGNDVAGTIAAID